MVSYRSLLQLIERVLAFESRKLTKSPSEVPSAGARADLLYTLHLCQEDFRSSFLSRNPPSEEDRAKVLSKKVTLSSKNAEGSKKEPGDKQKGKEGGSETELNGGNDALSIMLDSQDASVVLRLSEEYELNEMDSVALLVTVHQEFNLIGRDPLEVYGLAAGVWFAERKALIDSLLFLLKVSALGDASLPPDFLSSIRSFLLSLFDSQVEVRKGGKAERNDEGAGGKPKRVSPSPDTTSRSYREYLMHLISELNGEGAKGVGKENSSVGIAANMQRTALSSSSYGTVLSSSAVGIPPQHLVMDGRGVELNRREIVQMERLLLAQCLAFSIGVKRLSPTELKCLFNLLNEAVCDWLRFPCCTDEELPLTSVKYQTCLTLLFSLLNSFTSDALSQGEEAGGRSKTGDATVLSSFTPRVVQELTSSILSAEHLNAMQAIASSTSLLLSSSLSIPPPSPPGSPLVSQASLPSSVPFSSANPLLPTAQAFVHVCRFTWAILLVSPFSSNAVSASGNADASTLAAAKSCLEESSLLQAFSFLSGEVLPSGAFQSLDPDLRFLCHAYLDKLFSLFLSSSLGKEKLKQMKLASLLVQNIRSRSSSEKSSLPSAPSVPPSLSFPHPSSRGEGERGGERDPVKAQHRVQAKTFLSLLDLLGVLYGQVPDLGANNPALWHFVVFAGEEQRNYDAMQAYLDMLTKMASGEEGSRKVHELLQGNVLSIINWVTFFHTLRSFDNKLRKRHVPSSTAHNLPYHPARSSVSYHQAPYLHSYYSGEAPGPTEGLADPRNLPGGFSAGAGGSALPPVVISRGDADAIIAYLVCLQRVVENYVPPSPTLGSSSSPSPFPPSPPWFTDAQFESLFRLLPYSEVPPKIKAALRNTVRSFLKRTVRIASQLPRQQTDATESLSKSRTSGTGPRYFSPSSLGVSPSLDAALAFPSSSSTAPPSSSPDLSTSLRRVFDFAKRVRALLDFYDLPAIATPSPHSAPLLPSFDMRNECNECESVCEEFPSSLSFVRLYNDLSALEALAFGESEREGERERRGVQSGLIEEIMHRERAYLFFVKDFLLFSLSKRRYRYRTQKYSLLEACLSHIQRVLRQTERAISRLQTEPASGSLQTEPVSSSVLAEPGLEVLKELLSGHYIFQIIASLLSVGFKTLKTLKSQNQFSERPSDSDSSIKDENFGTGSLSRKLENSIRHSFSILSLALKLDQWLIDSWHSSSSTLRPVESVILSVSAAQLRGDISSEISAEIGGWEGERLRGMKEGGGGSAGGALLVSILDFVSYSECLEIQRMAVQMMETFSLRLPNLLSVLHLEPKAFPNLTESYALCLESAVERAEGGAEGGEERGESDRGGEGDGDELLELEGRLEGKEGEGEEGDLGVMILRFLLRSLSSLPPPNVSHLLLDFDVKRGVEESILTPKRKFSSLRVILDFLKPPLFPDSEEDEEEGEGEGMSGGEGENGTGRVGSSSFASSHSLLFLLLRELSTELLFRLCENQDTGEPTLELLRTADVEFFSHFARPLLLEGRRLLMSPPAASPAASLSSALALSFNGGEGGGGGRRGERGRGLVLDRLRVEEIEAVGEEGKKFASALRFKAWLFRLWTLALHNSDVEVQSHADLCRFLLALLFKSIQPSKGETAWGDGAAGESFTLVQCTLRTLLAPSYDPIFSNFQLSQLIGGKHQSVLRELKFLDIFSEEEGDLERVKWRLLQEVNRLLLSQSSMSGAGPSLPPSLPSALSSSLSLALSFCFFHSLAKEVKGAQGEAVTAWGELVQVAVSQKLQLLKGEDLIQLLFSLVDDCLLSLLSLQENEREGERDSDGILAQSLLQLVLVSLSRLHQLSLSLSFSQTTERVGETGRDPPLSVSLPLLLTAPETSAFSADVSNSVADLEYFGTKNFDNGNIGAKLGGVNFTDMEDADVSIWDSLALTESLFLSASQSQSLLSKLLSVVGGRGRAGEESLRRRLYGSLLCYFNYSNTFFRHFNYPFPSSVLSLLVSEYEGAGDGEGGGQNERGVFPFEGANTGVMKKLQSLCQELSDRNFETFQLSSPTFLQAIQRDLKSGSEISKTLLFSLLASLLDQQDEGGKGGDALRNQLQREGVVQLCIRDVCDHAFEAISGPSLPSLRLAFCVQSQLLFLLSYGGESESRKAGKGGDPERERGDFLRFSRAKGGFGRSKSALRLSGTGVVHSLARSKLVRMPLLQEEIFSYPFNASSSTTLVSGSSSLPLPSTFDRFFQVFNPLLQIVLCVSSLIPPLSPQNETSALGRQFGSTQKMDARKPSTSSVSLDVNSDESILEFVQNAQPLLSRILDDDSEKYYLVTQYGRQEDSGVGNMALKNLEMLISAAGIMKNLLSSSPPSSPRHPIFLVQMHRLCLKYLRINLDELGEFSEKSRDAVPGYVARLLQLEAALEMRREEREEERDAREFSSLFESLLSLRSSLSSFLRSQVSAAASLLEETGLIEPSNFSTFRSGLLACSHAPAEGATEDSSSSLPSLFQLLGFFSQLLSDLLSQSEQRSAMLNKILDVPEMSNHEIDALTFSFRLLPSPLSRVEMGSREGGSLHMRRQRILLSLSDRVSLREKRCRSLLFCLGDVMEIFLRHFDLFVKCLRSPEKSVPRIFLLSTFGNYEEVFELAEMLFSRLGRLERLFQAEKGGIEGVVGRETALVPGSSTPMPSSSPYLSSSSLLSLLGEGEEERSVLLLLLHKLKRQLLLMSSLLS